MEPQKTISLSEASNQIENRYNHIIERFSPRNRNPSGTAPKPLSAFRPEIREKPSQTKKERQKTPTTTFKQPSNPSPLSRFRPVAPSRTPPALIPDHLDPPQPMNHRSLWWGEYRHFPIYSNHKYHQTSRVLIPILMNNELARPTKKLNDRTIQMNFIHELNKRDIIRRSIHLENGGRGRHFSFSHFKTNGEEWPWLRRTAGRILVRETLRYHNMPFKDTSTQRINNWIKEDQLHLFDVIPAAQQHPHLTRELFNNAFNTDLPDIFWERMHTDEAWQNFHGTPHFYGYATTQRNQRKFLATIDHTEEEEIQASDIKEIFEVTSNTEDIVLEFRTPLQETDSEARIVYQYFPSMITNEGTPIPPRVWLMHIYIQPNNNHIVADILPQLRKLSHRTHHPAWVHNDISNNTLISRLRRLAFEDAAMKSGQTSITMPDPRLAAHQLRMELLELMHEQGHAPIEHLTDRERDWIFSRKPEDRLTEHEQHTLSSCRIDRNAPTSMKHVSLFK